MRRRAASRQLSGVRQRARSARARSEAGHDVAEAEGQRLFELGVGARAGIAVGAPPAELGGVAKARAFHVVVADLDHALGSQRHEREVLARVPARVFVLAWCAFAGFVGGPVPWVVLEAGDEWLQLGEQPSSFGHWEGADDTDRGELAVLLVQPEQQRADRPSFWAAGLVHPVPGDNAVGGSFVLDLEHDTLVRLIG